MIHSKTVSGVQGELGQNVKPESGGCSDLTFPYTDVDTKF